MPRTFINNRLTHINWKRSACVIILAMFLIRLFGITNPPLENSHDWRQCLTNMISRNLVETSPNPLYPMVDNGGRHTSNIIASEFPVFNYPVYLMSLAFGYQHWYGRLVNLLISSLACWFFFRWLSLYVSEKHAFSATLLLTVSIWFGFSRKTMPDIFSMSLMIMALYQAFLFVKQPGALRLMAFGILGALAVLAKLPAIFALSILAIPMFSRQTHTLVRLQLTLASAFITAAGYWWYFIWGEYLFRTYEYQLFFPMSLGEGFQAFLSVKDLALERFYFSAFQGFGGFVLFLAGIWICVKNRQFLPLQVFLSTFPVFFLFMIKTGNVFGLHSYYVIPFVPVMAFLAGAALEKVRGFWFALVLLAVTLESVANQQHEFFIPEGEKYKLTLETQVDTWVPAGEKIAIVATTGPQYLYFAHRKGWGLSQDQAVDTGYMKDVLARGYRYMVIVKKECKVQPHYKKVGESRDIIVMNMAVTP